MPDLGNSRRKLKIAIGAMLAADVVAMAVLFSPLVGSADSRTLQLNELRLELQKKTREVEPLRGMDKKIVLAKDQISGFYKDRFAAKDSDLANELGKLASENGVRIQQAKYTKEEAGKLRRNSGGNRRKFFRRLPATGAVHQYAGTVEAVFYGG